MYERAFYGTREIGGGSTLPALGAVASVSRSLASSLGRRNDGEALLTQQRHPALPVRSTACYTQRKPKFRILCG